MATQKNSKINPNLYPTDEYVGEDYRKAMGTPYYPRNYKPEEIKPVTVLNFGFPKPNSRQTLLSYHAEAHTLGTTIATPTATKRIYFAGVCHCISGSELRIYDGATGSGTTLYSMTSGDLVPHTALLPMPIEVSSSLKVASVGAGTIHFTIYFLEEIK